MPRPGQDRRDLRRILVEGLLPPQPVLADLLAVVGHVDDEGVFLQIVFAQGVQDLADEHVHAVDQSPVGGAGALNLRCADFLDVAGAAPPFYMGV